MKSTNTLFAGFLFIVAGAYGQDVHYNYDRGTTFASYKTCQWADLPGRVPDQLIDRDIKRSISAGPLQHPNWGRTTRKPGKIYLHVFDGPTGSLSPAALEQKVQSAIS